MYAMRGPRPVVLDFFLSWPIFCCTKVLWPINFLSFLNEYSSPGAYPESVGWGCNFELG